MTPTLILSSKLHYGISKPELRAKKHISRIAGSVLIADYFFWNMQISKLNMQNLEWYLADLKSTGKNTIETVEKSLTDMFIRLVRIYPCLYSAHHQGARSIKTSAWDSELIYLSDLAYQRKLASFALRQLSSAVWLAGLETRDIQGISLLKIIGCYAW